jgi:hypothetical protein
MKLFRSVLAVLALGIFINLPKVKGETPSPLPSMQTVIQHVMETSAAENTEYHTFNHHYYYQRDKVTEFYDDAGNVKDREEKQTTNNPVEVHAAGHHQPTVRPISYQKQAVEPPPSIHGVSLGKKEDLLNPDLLKRYTLTMTGREMINGRPALIVDFKPASNNLPVFNIKDRFLNCVAGRAWIDEGDMTLEKVDIHLNQKVSILGGLVGTVSKFSFSFDRERTPDGYWFTRDLAWHVEAHEATIARVVDHRESISDLQKIQ